MLSPSDTIDVDILVVGAGVAGLFTALKLAPRPVAVVTARGLGRGGSTPWAQGGIAAAVGDDDDPQLHFEDTVTAGDGLVDAAAARVLTEEGPARIDDLSAYGVQFDRTADGGYKVGREAAHRRDRIVHASGDRAGAAIMAALADAARRAPHIALYERIVIEDLLTGDGRVGGALAYDVEAQRRILLRAGETVLATGGLGGLYAVTTNPVRAQGHGLAFAARAGADIRDAEFVQFHPTALNVGVDPAPLATEALRGDGAVLTRANGERFMPDYHPDAELAPRDIVARAVEAEIAAGRGAFLDASGAIGGDFPGRYPTVFAACESARLDPRREPMPVAPAAHYHMGGVVTDLEGRATLEGLSAVGEVASTGVHGANRLASNSLLEAAVFGARIADRLRGTETKATPRARAPEDRLQVAPSPAPADAANRLRQAMSKDGALIRSASGLDRLQKTINEIERDAGSTSGLISALTAARLIATAARHRTESRGAHFRHDYPDKADACAHTLHRGGVLSENRPESIPLQGDAP
ncbi:MAG: L-aspartate oxidase [Pseudomonadota bacterium]